MSKKELSASNLIDVSFFEDKKAHDAEKHRNRLRNPEYVKKQNEKLKNKLSAEEYNELPECKICGFKGKQLYKHVSSIHGMSIDEYKSKYDGPTETKEYLEHLSKSRQGENNPMYNKGESENSPWSVEFYIKKGYSEDEASKLKQEFIENVKKSKLPSSEPTRIEYYMNKYDIDEEEATDMLYKRQQTNSVESIAKRNNISLVEAQKIRDDITKKWINTLNKKTPEEINSINKKKMSGHNVVSQSSLDFFESLCEYIELPKSLPKYGNSELLLEDVSDKKTLFRKYDFTIGNKIIEYNGDRYHANPNIYSADDIPLTWRTCKSNSMYNKTAQDIWDYDKHKIELAKKHGYEVFVVWHSDVKKNIYRELRKCKEFLEE